MNTLIVYDTSFGNTERIADAIGDGLETFGEVRVVTAAEADIGAPTDLLLVGGPTQRHGMSPALGKLLHGLAPRTMRGVTAATFDTRYRMARFLSGSAAADAARQLERAGCSLVAGPESFFVERDRPPQGEKRQHGREQLEPGEIGRARAWGAGLAVLLVDKASRAAR